MNKISPVSDVMAACIVSRLIHLPFRLIHLPSACISVKQKVSASSLDIVQSRLDNIQKTFTSWTASLLLANMQTNNLPLQVVNCYILSSRFSLHPSHSAFFYSFSRPPPLWKAFWESRWTSWRMSQYGTSSPCVKTNKIGGEEAGLINNERALKERRKIRRSKHLLMWNESQSPSHNKLAHWR